MASYRRPRFTADFNLSYIKTFKSRLFDSASDLILLFDQDIEIPYVTTGIDDNNNTPHVMANAVLSWQVTKRLNLHTHLAYCDGQTTYSTDLVTLLNIIKYESLAIEAKKAGDIEAFQELYDQALDACQYLIYHKDVPSRFIINVGGEYQIGRLTLGLNIHNLLDKRYFQSGMNTKLVPQKGRWFMASIAYKF